LLINIVGLLPNYRRAQSKEGNWQNPVDTPLFYWYNTYRIWIGMSVKILLLKSGETLICDVKEMIEKDDLLSKEKVWGYLLTEPFRVNIQQPVFLTEESKQSKNPIEVVFSPWIVLTNDKKMLVPFDWIVTIVDPIKEVKEMYEEKVNEQNSKVSFTES